MSRTSSSRSAGQRTANVNSFVPKTAIKRGSPPAETILRTGDFEPTYWRSLSDEQLIETSFRTDDPTILENLLKELPLTDETPIVESEYDTKSSTGRLVHCVHCKHETHYRGFVLLLRAGQRMLVGKDCGKKIYGADFEKIERDFSDARQRAQYLRIKASVIADTENFCGALRLLKNHPSLGLFRDFKRTWNQAMPELARALAEICVRGDGALYITERVRDFSAEERREEKQNENAKLLGTMTKTAARKARERGDLPTDGKRPKPLYKDIPKFLGTLRGRGFFRTDQLPNARIDELAARAEQILDQLPGGRYSTTQLRVVFRDLRQVVEALVAEAGRLSEVLDAFEVRNLTHIANWASERNIGGHSYSATIGKITRHDRFGGEAVSVSFPAQYLAPSVAPLERFLRVIR